MTPSARKILKDLKEIFQIADGNVAALMELGFDDDEKLVSIQNRNPNPKLPPITATFEQIRNDRANTQTAIEAQIFEFKKVFSWLMQRYRIKCKYQLLSGTRQIRMRKGRRAKRR